MSRLAHASEHRLSMIAAHNAPADPEKRKNQLLLLRDGIRDEQREIKALEKQLAEHRQRLAALLCAVSARENGR